MLSPNSNLTTLAKCRSKADPRQLREDHFLCLLMDAVVAVHAAAKLWLKRRRTQQLLAALDEHQLRDIGLIPAEALSQSARSSAALARRTEATRVSCTASKVRRYWPVRDMSRRALAGLDDDQLNNLSDTGRQVRREARRANKGA